jgi:aminoglycoside phosphotransferase (APT) family kinase protein
VLRKMHKDEVDTDVSLVARLIEGQYPEWADLPITAVASSGTDNALYRLGADLVVRLPRIHWATAQIEKEREWLPRLAPHLPLAIPAPLVVGAPAEGYPWDWAVYRWLKGRDATAAVISDKNAAAIDLARFISALQRLDSMGNVLPMGLKSRGRGLATRDKETREALAALRGTMDTGAAIAVWEAALRADVWAQKPVFFHGDLMLGNVLVDRGRICAVIDFSGLGIGDPACDLMIAWSLFSGESREVFRKELAVDDATWERGRAHALSQALIFIPYYLETNPVGVANAWKVVDEVLADFARSC